MSGEKTIPATPQRRKKAVKEGNVLKSQVFQGGLTLLLGGIGSVLLLRFVLVKIAILVTSSEGIKPVEVSRYFSEVGWIGVVAIGVFLGGISLGGVIVSFVLSGCQCVPLAIRLRLEQLSPVSGVKRIFRESLKLWEVFVRVIVLIAAGALFLFYAFRSFFFLNPMHWEDIWTWIRKLLLTGSGILGLALLLVGVLDLFMRWREREKKLKMSLQEFRDEIKESDGDPFMKSTRRGIHEELLQQDIKSAVRQSKVIIVDRNT